jgi:uncharacterized caspase-like protein
MKRAVVVGVNNYSVLDPSGKKNLNYSVRDARQMYWLLKDAFLFDAVYYYEDLNASSQNILSALRYILSTSEPGDSACFYFSGHGARVRADLAQADCDRYYETLVPASGAWITDRDLFALTDQLEPDHVNFTVITDACHSGGLHSADEDLKCRSPLFYDALIEAIVSFMRTLIPCGLCLPPDSQDMANNVTNVRDRGDGSIDLDADPDKTLVAACKSTLLAACRYQELSWESQSLGQGLMTQALLDIVNTSNFSASYHEVMEQTRSRVGQRFDALIRPHYPDRTQTPQLYGQRNRMEEEFLAGWIHTPGDV